jgi:hypothetical protein
LYNLHYRAAVRQALFGTANISIAISIAALLYIFYTSLNRIAALNWADGWKKPKKN